MNYHRFVLILLTLFLSYSVVAQKVNANFEDTVYYNIDFKRTKTRYVHYYRPPVLRDSNGYKVEYYTIKHIPIFKGRVRSVKIDYNYSIEPSVAIKDGFCAYYNEKGCLSAEGEFSNNYKTGTWKYYYDDSSISRIEEYYKEQPALYQTSFYRSGKKLMEGLKVRVAYKGDTSFRYHGMWVFYYKNGKISSTENYKLGEPDGQHVYYDTNGVKTAEGNVKYTARTSITVNQTSRQQLYLSDLNFWSIGQIVRDGKWIFYDRTNRKVQSIQRYDYGMLDSAFVFYHSSSGKPKVTGLYEKGIRVGTWIIYFDGTDKVQARTIYKDNVGEIYIYDSLNTETVLAKGRVEKDMRIGEWVHYYPENGKVMSKVNYTKNLLNGTAVGYDSSGALFSEVEYKNGIADGKCTYYYKGTKDKWVVLQFAADTFTGFVNTFYEDGKIKRKTKSPSGDLIQICYDRNGNVIDCLPLYTQAQFDGDVMTYIGQHLEYPEEARRMRLEGKVKVGFVIDEFGKVQDPYIVEGFDERCNNAALQLVSQMPNWIPSTIEDIPVRAFKTLPIVFWLPPEEEEASGIAEGM